MQIQLRILQTLFFSFCLVIMLASCSSGGNSATVSYAQVAVPVTNYQDGDKSKLAVYTKAGGGAATLTEIDTGSYYYVIESSYIGSNVRMTNHAITLIYDHGDIARSGVIAYARVNLLNSDGSSLLTTSEFPLVVVPDGTISNSPSQNHAIMGMRMNSQVALKLYLPYPYNQMFILDAAQKTLTFGNLNAASLESFGMLQLVKMPCLAVDVEHSATNQCWNDMAVPVSYTVNYQGQEVESTLNTLFDSGASSSFQFIPIPEWLMAIDGIVTNDTLMPMVATTKGRLPIQLTTQVAAVASQVNGGIVNAGNNLFNYYRVVFNQNNGMIGLQAY